MSNAPGSRDYHVSSGVIGDTRALGADWMELQQRADCSYFQSWGWIGNWLEQLAADLEPLLVRVWRGAELVGLGVFVGRHVRRHLLVRSSVMYLHEYPSGARNMSIEYNGLLVARGHEQAVWAATTGHLFRAGHAPDEVFFGALDSAAARVLCDAVTGNAEIAVSCRVLEESSTAAVALRQIGAGLDDYLATLGKNRRAQVRRALRLFGEQSPLQVQVAADTAEALQYFDALGQLHTTRWQAAGKPGSFANSRWVDFHRVLIESRFAHGEIGLLRVTNADGAIGYLYNLAWRGRVYVLQSGFRMYADKRLMPGYVVHVLAIQHYRDAGMDCYDLMHGDALYKRLLCNRSETLRWIVLQQPRWKFRLEAAAAQLVRKLRVLVGNGRQP